jgi:hypothetical protein
VVRFHKPKLTPAHADTLKQARAAVNETRAADAAAQATEEQLADWVLAELRSGRTLAELVGEWSTESAGIDLAAIVDRRLGIDR